MITHLDNTKVFLNGMGKTPMWNHDWRQQMCALFKCNYCYIFFISQYRWWTQLCVWNIVCENAGQTYCNICNVAKGANDKRTGVWHAIQTGQKASFNLKFASHLNRIVSLGLLYIEVWFQISGKLSRYRGMECNNYECWWDMMWWTWDQWTTQYGTIDGMIFVKIKHEIR